MGADRRRRTRRILLFAALLCAVGLVAPGCARRAPGPAQKPPERPAPPADVLRFNLGGEPATLDPARAEDAAAATAVYQLFEGLTRKTAKGIEPGAAERWDVSPDGLKYVFHLRDARWSNGTPLTADDFEFAWKRLLDPASPAPYAYQLFVLKGAEAYHRADPRRYSPAGLAALRDAVGVRALDERTLEVELRAPAPYFPEIAAFFACMPVPRKAVEADPRGWWAEPERFAGNGPFRLGERRRERWTLVKNELYWDRRSVSLKRIDLSTVSDPGTALGMFEGGEIDMAMPRQVPLLEVPRLLESGQARQAPLLATYFLAFNTARPPFHDARVRRAFSLAIDRRELVERAVQGLPHPAAAFVPPGIRNPATGVDFRTEGGGSLPAADPETARALLAQAGYPGGRGFPRVRVLYNLEGEHRDVVAVLAEMWRRNLGVEVEAVGQDWRTYVQSRNSGDFHVVRMGWIGDYADPSAFLDLFAGGDPRNASRWRNARYDALLEEARRTPDAGARMALFHRAEEVLLQEAPLAPVYHYVQVWLQGDRVRDVYVDPQGNAFFRTARLLPAGGPAAAGRDGAGG